MENVIREGALKQFANETPCDVVLSCRGRKLSAHKLILSIASPVLQGLFLQDCTDTTVLILPDVDPSTMTLILDYIYNGNVTVSAYGLKEFLNIASLLQLQLDYDYLDKSKIEPLNKEENTIKSDFSSSTFEPKKHARKVPNLMPISSLPKTTTRKGLYNRVFPSPWCPRVVPLLADPREECLMTNEQMVIPHSTKHIEENDTNNNFQVIAQQPGLPNALSGKEEPLLDCTNPFFPGANSSKSPVCVEFTEEKKLQVSEKKTVIASSDAEKQEDPPVRGLKVKDNTRSARSSDEEAKKGEANDKHKPFKCNDCGKCFSQLRNYKYHRSIHEGTREFAARCPECGKIFNDRGYLSSHLKIHRDRKEYACPNCPKRFNQRVAYNMHLRIHTGIKPHECPTCGKTFSRKMLLKQHQRVHTGERPYSCPECGKSFADRSNMSLHARLHTGVKPYACNLCPKSFTKKHHLKTHMNFHTGLKPYSCQKCGLSFSQSSNMRTHYKKCILKSPTSSTT